MAFALVYMRGDWIRDALGKASLEPDGALERYARLLNHDVVRHLRNALSHGHIAPTSVGLHIRDRAYESIVSPGMIDGLCNWMLFLHLSVMAAYITARERGAESR